MSSQTWGTNVLSTDGDTPAEALTVQMVEFGALPNNNTTSVAHNIAGLVLDRVVDLYGIATDGTDVFTLPRFHATLALGARLQMSATDVSVVTTGDLSAFTNCKIFISYLP